MARKKGEGVNVDAESVSELYDLSGIVKDLNKLNENVPKATFLSEEALSNVKEWISTGNYALNGILSGNLRGGIPEGRVIGFSGPSGVGKSFFLCKIMKNAIKMGYQPFYFDSEGAIDNEFVARMGIDVSKVLHFPVSVIEDVEIKMKKLLDGIVLNNKKIEEINKINKANGEPEIERLKCIFFLDSLGNLHTSKEEADIDSDKVAADMGMRAKAMGSFLRLITAKAAAAKVPVIFSNHTYDDPSSLYPTLVKKQSGGQKVLYMASQLVQLSQCLEKVADNKDEEKSSLSDKTVGRRIHALTTKNRFRVDELSIDMFLNYKTGLDPYSGLLDLAERTGYITRSGPTYYLGETKLGYASAFDNKEFWDAHLDELNVVVDKETQLSCELPDIE